MGDSMQLKGDERIKHDLLVLWVKNNKKMGDYAPMDKFDKVYKALFGRRPLWYGWGFLSRDHGCVGILKQERYL